MGIHSSIYFKSITSFLYIYIYLNNAIISLSKLVFQTFESVLLYILFILICNVHKKLWSIILWYNIIIGAKLNLNKKA